MGATWPCRHSGCLPGGVPGVRRALLLVLRSSGLHWALSAIIGAVRMQVRALQQAWLSLASRCARVVHMGRTHVPLLYVVPQPCNGVAAGV
jgi:hypothetical protein